MNTSSIVLNSKNYSLFIKCLIEIRLEFFFCVHFSMYCVGFAVLVYKIIVVLKESFRIKLACLVNYMKSL